MQLCIVLEEVLQPITLFILVWFHTQEFHEKLTQFLRCFLISFQARPKAYPNECNVKLRAFLRIFLWVNMSLFCCLFSNFLLMEFWLSVILFACNHLFRLDAGLYKIFCTACSTVRKPKVLVKCLIKNPCIIHLRSLQFISSLCLSTLPSYYVSLAEPTTFSSSSTLCIFSTQIPVQNWIFLASHTQ